MLTILTMKRKPLISTVTSPCLICLAIVDTIVLNTGLMRYWILFISGADLRNLTDIGCKLHRLVHFPDPLASGPILHTRQEIRKIQLASQRMCTYL